MIIFLLFRFCFCSLRKSISIITFETDYYSFTRPRNCLPSSAPTTNMREIRMYCIEILKYGVAENETINFLYPVAGKLPQPRTKFSN